MQNFKDLIIWSQGRELVKDVYLLTKAFPKEELYSLTNQIRRCAISIPANIAEGAGRNSRKEFFYFLNISSGSLSELESHLILASDLEYLNHDVLEKVSARIHALQKMVRAFMSSVQGKQLQKTND